MDDKGRIIVLESAAGIVGYACPSMSVRQVIVRMIEMGDAADVRYAFDRDPQLAGYSAALFQRSEQRFIGGRKVRIACVLSVVGREHFVGGRLAVVLVQPRAAGRRRAARVHAPPARTHAAR